MSVSGSIHDILKEEVTSISMPCIRPYRLIVAWNGVLTLAFEAWPKQLMNIKQRINSTPEFNTLVESFGTRWPKVTLAAFKTEDTTITIDELKKLTSLCREFDTALQSMEPVPLECCSTVMFTSRSLENYLFRVDYAFMPRDEEDGHLSLYNQEYDKESYTIVQKVIEETEQLDIYIDKVNTPGNRWEEHYNTVWTEATLVCFLTNKNNNNNNSGENDVQEVKDVISSSTSNLTNILSSFQTRVNALLPNTYTWMPTDSLHLSIRALENRSNVPREIYNTHLEV